MLSLALKRVENLINPLLWTVLSFFIKFRYFFFSVEGIVTCDEAHLLETSILGRDESFLAMPLFLLTMDEA